MRCSSAHETNSRPDGELTQDHIDYLSIQSLMFKDTSLGFVGQVKLFFEHTKRIKD
jgi:hypothetical protein